MSNIQNSFGNAIRKRRLDLGLSQEKLAAKSDLHRTYISDIERGHRNVSLLNIMVICEALEIKASLLFIQIENE